MSHLINNLIPQKSSVIKIYYKDKDTRPEKIEKAVYFEN